MVRLSCRKNVRILLLGDKLVGKTSIILSLVSEEFPEDVPCRAEEITIPADVTPELIPTHIVDYCESEQSDDILVAEIQKAHVICAIYSVVDDESLARLSSHWLPFIREHVGDPCPVVLVGNKVDLISDSTYENAAYIMEEFPEIESFVECSAKTLLNVSELFYYAQNAVLHPTAPLYIVEKRELTEACKNALLRIFKICDKDNDGLLSDRELNHFQKRCFGAPLRRDIIEDIKAIIAKNISGGISSHNNYVTLTGFLFLHNLFMQRGRSQTTWAVLRKFGYQENLQLSNEYLYPKLVVPNDCTVELSHKGHKFLSNLFDRHDKDKDGALSPKEANALFSICPAPAFDNRVKFMVPTNSKGWITAEGWSCFWTYTTYFDHTATFKYLAYLGYVINDTENQCSAVLVTREKKTDVLKKQSLRNVYVCHVIGERGCGKSSICQTHLGFSIKDNGEESIANTCRGTINICSIYGQEKYLIMKAVNIGDSIEPLMPGDVRCDVACLTYDTSRQESFQYVAGVFLRYFCGSKIPVVMVANKQDLDKVVQKYISQPEVFCEENGLGIPIEYSCSRPSSELFSKLATAAAFPHSYSFSLMNNCMEYVNYWKTGVGMVILATMAVIAARFFKTEKSPR